MNQNPFDNNDQFVVSHELLQLLRWLLENEQETLKKLLSKAFSKGLHEKLHHTQSFNELDTNEDLQQNIIDFFSLLEILTYELSQEREVTAVMNRDLLPSIDRVDSKTYDSSIVDTSISKAAIAYENNPKQDPKEIFCKELLKRWKPSKKGSVH